MSRHYGWGATISQALDQLRLPQELGAKVHRGPIVSFIRTLCLIRLESGPSLEAGQGLPTVALCENL